MKIIFLDIDGVLNCSESKSECLGYTGIDTVRLKRLKRIIEETNGKIILISTWKEQWYKELFNKGLQDELANYLDRKFKRERLSILDKTIDIDNSRGKGILQALSRYNAEQFIVLDDEAFDYKELNLLPHLVKTEYSNGGLTEELANKIIALLKGENHV